MILLNPESIRENTKCPKGLPRILKCFQIEVVLGRHGSFGHEWAGRSMEQGLYNAHRWNTRVTRRSYTQALATKIVSWRRGPYLLRASYSHSGCQLGHIGDPIPGSLIARACKTLHPTPPRKSGRLVSRPCCSRPKPVTHCCKPNGLNSASYVDKA